MGAVTEIERAREIVENKARFLSNMSHEIRTQMNGIFGNLQMLLSEDLNPRQRSYAEDAKVSSDMLLEIINDILDHSKIKTGKVTLSPTHYDFYQLIDHLNSSIKYCCKEKNLSFELITEGELPKFVFGDDVKLGQILKNLLNNAVKFTDEGYVRLTIRALKDNTLHFEIKDTGTGICEKDLAVLFDAFVQVDMRKNRNKKGTGLGLSITKALIELMGGRISVESVYGKGSTFHVIIPVELGDEAKILTTDDNESNVYAPEAKILVVDDSSINLNVACGLLKLNGITAKTADSGKQAIEMIQNSQFDLVFMDQNMPEMSGVETVKIIRIWEQENQRKQIPIIALTAIAEVGVKQVFLEAGMNDLLTKPIIIVSLNKMLEKWLPTEKIKKAEGEIPVAEKSECEMQTDFWRKIESIEGLCVQTGLERVSGKLDVYEKSLRLAIMEIEKSTKNLDKYLTIGDLQSFGTEIHGIKGSLANIGAMELSLQASNLETAANQSDKTYCEDFFPFFLDGLNFLHHGIAHVFSERNQSHGELVIPPELPSIFKRLIDAFSKMDFIGIDEGMIILNSLKAEGALKEEIEKIKVAVLMMEYENAKKIMENCLKQN